MVVRIGTLSSGGKGPDVQPAPWPRKFVSVVTLVASVVALALVIDGQSDQFLGHPQKVVPEPFFQTGGTDGAFLPPMEESRYRALSEFVAKRYRVSQDVAFDLVSLAHQEGSRFQLDPLLIIAVIAIESRFNPIAESGAGAKGLMQIIPKYHTDKLEEYGVNTPFSTRPPTSRWALASSASTSAVPATSASRCRCTPERWATARTSTRTRY